MYRNTRNETKKSLLLATSYTAEPFCRLARWKQRPLKEWYRVVKPEHGVIILNIIRSQQIIELLGLLLVIEIQVAPSVASGQRIGCQADLLECFVLDLSVEK